MDSRSSEAALRALMVASLDGDANAYQQLLAVMSSRLRAYFKRKLIPIGRDASAAEDLLQDVLMAIHTRRHTYDQDQLFTPWMYAIARYKFRDYLRRTKASALEVELGGADELMARDDQESVESGIDLEKLMAHLSPKLQEAIRYVKLDGLSVNEAATRSGRSPSAIKVSVHRGLKTLARLAARGQER